MSFARLRIHSQLDIVVDLCEGDILVPLTFDGKDQVTVKSTKFPYKRSTPLICSWNVQVISYFYRVPFHIFIDDNSSATGD